MSSIEKARNPAELSKDMCEHGNFGSCDACHRNKAHDEANMGRAELQAFYKNGTVPAEAYDSMLGNKAKGYHAGYVDKMRHAGEGRNSAQAHKDNWTRFKGQGEVFAINELEAERKRRSETQQSSTTS